VPGGTGQNKETTMPPTEKIWAANDAELRDVFAQLSQAIEDSVAKHGETLAYDQDIDHVCTVIHKATGRRFTVRIYEETK